MANVYTQAGEEWVIDQIDGANSFWIGWGTGAGTTAKGDTTLFTESTEARASAVKSQPAADRIQWVATLTADGAKTITNAGVFTASTAGTLVVKGDHGGVALALNDSIEYTISLEQT
jgi:hypothetical protein